MSSVTYSFYIKKLVAQIIASGCAIRLQAPDLPGGYAAKIGYPDSAEPDRRYQIDVARMSDRDTLFHLACMVAKLRKIREVGGDAYNRRDRKAARREEEDAAAGILQESGFTAMRAFERWRKRGRDE